MLNAARPFSNPEVEQTHKDEIDLSRLFLTIWSFKWSVALIAASTVVVGVFYVLITPPTFRADALLQLEQRGASLGLPTAMQELLETPAQSTTQLEILRSRMVLGRAVADLNLDWQVKPAMLPLIGYAVAKYRIPLPDFGLLSSYAQGGEHISLSLLRVPPDWLGDTIYLKIAGRGTFSVMLPDGRGLEGAVGEPLALDDNGATLQVASLAGNIGRAFEIVQVTEATAVQSLRNRLTVSEVGRQSGILQTTFIDEDPTHASSTLAAIVSSYVDQNVERSAAEVRSGLQFVNEQLPAAEDKLKIAEQALNDYRQGQQSIDLTFQAQNVLTQITRIDTELEQLQREEDQIKQRYTESHPIYQQILSQRKRMEEQRAALDQETSALPETQQVILNLTRDLELAQTSYVELLRRAQELRVLQASTVGNVRLIDTAQTAANAVAPRRSVILALAGMLGLGLGIAVALLRNWIRRGVQGSEELENAGLPVFATINHYKKLEGADMSGRAREILAQTDPTDLTVESFRSLRTSLHFGMLNANTKSIAITSSAPGAGKSFTCVNLAAVASEAGQTVCLIDADMRRGQLHKYFGGSKKGLSQYLAGQASLRDVLIKVGDGGIYFLPAGEYPPNPSELLMRPRFAHLLRALDQRFDLTIIDTPPVLVVTDAAIVGQSAGAMLAVVRFDVTPIGEVQAMKRSLEGTGVSLSGAVLNDFDPRKAKAGSYSYEYNYRYSYK